MNQPAQPKPIRQSKHRQSPVMRQFHEKRRDEVVGRFWEQLNKEANAPMQQADTNQLQRWIPICKHIFDATYNYFDACGKRDLVDYQRTQEVAVRQIMQQELCGSTEDAREQVKNLCKVACSVTGEIHATDKQREVMHRMSDHVDELFKLPNSTERRRNGWVRDVLDSSAANFDYGEAVREFFLKQTDQYWDDNEPAQRLMVATLATPYTPRNIEIAMTRELTLDHIDTERLAQPDDTTVPADTVIEFLKEHKLLDDAKRVWVTERLQDKAIEVAQEVVKRLHIQPGQITAKQTREGKAAFDSGMVAFMKDLTDKQHDIMPNPDFGQRLLMIHDARELHHVLGDAFGEFLAKGVVHEGQMR